MGEIFSWAKPRNALQFTGERWTSAASGQIEIEHVHRYLAARDLCRGKDVLDIACGEGYGAAMLAQVARRVVGVDVDVATVAHAAAEYAGANLYYIAGDARRIPLATASVDTVVSFETLEHFAEQEAFLAELCRVLRPHGVLILSTPDSDVYSPIGGPANHYHVRELSRDEFAAALSAQFAHVVLLGQRPLIGSALVPRGPATGLPATVTYERRDEVHFERSAGLPRALYLIACASNRPLAQPPGPSLYIHTSQVDATLGALVAARAELQELHGKLQAAETELRQACDGLQVAQQQIAELRSEREAGRTILATAQSQLADVQTRADDLEIRVSQLRSIEESTIWRATAVLRASASRLPRPVRVQLRRGARLTYWLLTPHRLPERIRFLRQRRRATREAGAAPRLPEPDAVGTGPADPGPDGAQGAPDEHVTRRQAASLGIAVRSPPPSVAVGIITYETDRRSFERVVSSAEVAMARAGLRTERRIFILDNGDSTSHFLPKNRSLARLASAGNIGFAAGHNRLMRTAFTEGAEIYVAANPDGMFHPDALTAMLQMSAANRGNCLVEAVQFPEEHPKPYDPQTFETPWASAACLAIPRAAAEIVGGFDEAFFMYCEDVDLSWRARAAGLAVKICPRALFLHAVTNRPQTIEKRRMFVEGGIVLARKWGAAAFERHLLEELRTYRVAPPDKRPAPVPAAWRAVANFAHQGSFAPARW
jgi:SAM-dependent methyltransferase